MTIRLATAALSNRIMAGTPNKKGDGFKGSPFDVTSDCLKAISEYIGVGYKVTVSVDGVPKFEISVTDIEKE